MTYEVDIDVDDFLDEVSTNTLIVALEDRGFTVVRDAVPYLPEQSINIDISNMSLGEVNLIKEILTKNNITYEG